jgi:hypothetical protein
MNDDLKDYRAPRLLFDLIEQEPALILIVVLIVALISDWFAK